MWEKYKEAPPRDTVDHIRCALSNVGVQMEAIYMEPVENVVSVRLIDREHGFETYGKGTSREWALASAYGEAAERFQNRLLYEIPEPEPNDGFSFREWPDEEPVSIREALQAPHIMEDFSSHYCDKDHPVEEFLLNFFKTDSLSLVPYRGMKQNCTYMLPDRIISLLCGSNGLAAGNTYDEATCQGLCEIGERYSKFLMFRENIAPVTVPEEYIEKEAPELCQVMKDIEKGTGCRLILRDARPVTGFPVLQVLLVDSVHQKYYTRFGCHPVFMIALERSITELLQGQNDLSRISSMISWPQERNIQSFRNLSDSLKADLADLSDEFLAGATDREFVPWPKKEFSNRDGVKELIDCFLRIAPEVFIRKTGFLGIPSVRIYIPGISALPLQFSHRVHDYNYAKSILHDPNLVLKKLDTETLHLLLSAFTSDDSLVGNRIDWRSADIGYNEMKGLLLYMLGCDAEAMAAFEKTESLPGKCMSHYLRMTLDGKDRKVIKSVLELFFGKTTADFTEIVCSDRSNALAAWLDPTGMYRKFLGIISVKDSTSSLSELEKKVKERMLKVYDGRSPDQWNGVLEQL